MPLSEAGTRAKLIDPSVHARGWTVDLIRRKERAGAIEMMAHYFNTNTACGNINDDLFWWLTQTCLICCKGPQQS